jgi:hypothetical protein
LEATVVSYSDEEMAAQTRWNVVLDLVDEVFNPDFSVAVHVKVAGQETPSKRDIVPHIEEWLASLDWADAQAVSQLDERDLPVRDWVVRLRPYPRPPSARGCVGGWGRGLGARGRRVSVTRELVRWSCHSERVRCAWARPSGEVRSRV